MSGYKATTFLLLSLLCLGPLVPGLGANPYADVSPEAPLYRRVLALGEQGLLDPQDLAVLKRGEIVSRLELALAVEKAAKRLDMRGTQTAQALPPLPPGPDLSAARREIRELLLELREEASELRAHLNLMGARLSAREDEMARLKPVQDRLDGEWKKADQTSGVPSLHSRAEFRFENLGLSGIARENATRIEDEAAFGIWTDLGGKGSLTFGVGGVQSLSNASVASTPVSVYTSPLAANFILDGPLGRWSTHAAVEAYHPDTTLGDFVRGASPTSLRRFIDPVDIANFNDNKDTKTWDDHMNTLGYVPLSFLAAGNASSAGDRVFDGLYAIGTGLPLVSPEARVNVMLGRMGTSSTQTQRWEKEFRYTQPWAGGRLRTSAAGTWVNDYFGLGVADALDLDNYAGDVAVIAKPVYLRVEGAYSRLDAGPSYGPPLESGGGQASASYYPLSFHATSIGAGYSNFQSKVLMSGVRFDRYGEDMTHNRAGDMYGAVAESDSLVSNRRGWRVNLGWDGRQQPWMRRWPAFLDTFLLDLDAARKREFTAVASPMGYNVVEPFNFLTFYYPDDEGLWGRQFWGGWGSGEDGAYSVRRRYTQNLQAIRNDGNGYWDDTRHQFQISSERIPLILPAAVEPVQEVDGRPVTTAPGVPNSYLNLDHRKSYRYLTLTAKLHFDRMLRIQRRLYGSLYFTDHRVSGTTRNPVLAGTPDPYRPGRTLAEIPDLFTQRVTNASFMVQFFRRVNLMADAGRETWHCDYTYPRVDYRTDSLGGGWAYDLPWGGGKLEMRYRHLSFSSRYTAANDYEGDQVYSTLMLLF